MEQVIKTIINSKIPKDCFFDAHAIINYLILHHNSLYISSKKDNWTDAYYHSEISKMIASFEEILIKREGESWSMNINNDFNPNKCWRKL